MAAEEELVARGLAGEDDSLLGAGCAGVFHGSVARWGIEGVGDEAIGANDEKAGGHIARDFFAEASGVFGALAFGLVQPLQLFFLFAKLQDDGLHGSGHERGSILDAGN